MKIDKKNSCIYILSGRKTIIEECVERIYDFYNHRFNFPVYIYYFDRIYGDSPLTDKLKKKYKVSFIKQKTTIPKHINFKELFFNRDYPYVKKSFGQERINYLHMCDFVTNTNNKPDLKNFQFHHRIDDDTFINKKIDDNLFEIMFEKNYPMATSTFWSHYHSNARDVGMYLFDFYKNYIKENKLNPKNTDLKKAIYEDDETKFHTLNWSIGNFNLYNQFYLRDNQEWKKWIKKINEYGGIYKYRWDDIKLIGLYLYTFFENPCLNLNLVNDRSILSKTKKANTITNLNFFNYWSLKIYRKIRYQILSDQE